MSGRARCRTSPVPDEQVVTDLLDQARNLSWLLAAEDGALTFPQLETPLLVVVAAVAAAARPSCAGTRSR